MPFRRALALLLAVPSLAFAHSVADQLTVTGTQATATNPRQGSVANRISGDFDVSDGWGVHTDLTLTHEDATPALATGSFAETGGFVLDALGGVDWDVSDQVTLGLDLALSPSSTTTSNTSLGLVGALSGTLVNAQLKTVASSSGFTLSASWLSPDPDADWQTALDFSLGGDHFDSRQRITAVAGPTGVVSPVELRNQCDQIAAEPLPSDTTSLAYKKLSLQKATCRQLLPALGGKEAALDQGTLAAAITETLYRDTDVGLAGSFVLYAQDPTTVGFFTLTTAGRRHLSMGEGIDVAPVRWTLSPSVTHRFGALSAQVSAEYAKYVAGQGHSGMLGVRLEYRFSKTYRAWVRASGQNDTDGTGATTHSGTAGGGLRISF